VFVAPRGTMDILPEEQPYWNYLYRHIAEVVEVFGYQRIDVPVFEDTDLFARGVGEGTDIVDKEMYSFQDKGGRDLTLRPEFTAGVVRAYLQHGMKTWPQPVKLYTVGPIFRYERVQAGRYRQHTQFDIECIGELDPAVDYEVISLAWELYSRLGFAGLGLQVNSTGCPRCRPGYLQRLVTYYEGHRDDICDNCKRRLERNPLRLLDCKNPECQPIIVEAPHIDRFLCDECEGHFLRLRRYLDVVGRPYTVNHRLVRGLDYYTKTVFEVWAAGIGAQNAICGGGRYDGLAEQLGGEHTPGIGFGSGMERLVLTLKEQGIEVPGVPVSQVALVYRGEEAKERAVQLVDGLRREGIRAGLTFGDRSLRAQLRAADREGVRYVLIVGDEELARGEVTVRDMAADVPQEAVPLGGVLEWLKQRLQSTG